METILSFIPKLQSLFDHSLILVGVRVIVAYYWGLVAKYVNLPSIIGYMLWGIILGPSLLDIMNETFQTSLSFITEIALGFVAFSIGLELNLTSLKRYGNGIVTIIFLESFGAFIIVFAGVYAFTRNLPLSIIFAAIAPASAPAGTVAIIQEYKAKGSLTQALYAVVGFDDGLGVIIFGFAVAIAKNILLQDAGSSSQDIWHILASPFREIIISALVGTVLTFIFCVFARRLKDSGGLFILVFGFVLLVTGICGRFHLSLIFTNMIAGLLVINTQAMSFTRQIKNKLPDVMPLLFILFFTLAGSSLHIDKLPSLGLLGILYVFCRTVGLMGGSYIGGVLGKVEANIRKYTGMGILSQAGLAIGLSLIVKNDFKGIGPMIQGLNAEKVSSGDYIGTVVITTITATCVFFEIIGPILTRIALLKAGEIKKMN